MNKIELERERHNDHEIGRRIVRIESVESVDRVNEMLKDPYVMLYQTVQSEDAVRFIMAETKRPPASVAGVGQERPGSASQA